MKLWIVPSYKRPIKCDMAWGRYGFRGWRESFGCIRVYHRCHRTYFHTGDCRCDCGAILTIAEQDAVL